MPQESEGMSAELAPQGNVVALEPLPYMEDLVRLRSTKVANVPSPRRKLGIVENFPGLRHGLGCAEIGTDRRRLCLTPIFGYPYQGSPIRGTVRFVVKLTFRKLYVHPSLLQSWPETHMEKVLRCSSALTLRSCTCLIVILAPSCLLA